MNKAEALDLLKDRAFMMCAVDLCDMDCQDCHEALNMAIEALRQEPICCKDCKNWHSPGGTDKERKGWCSVWKSRNYSKTDDYCSYAERMESDTE